MTQNPSRRRAAFADGQAGLAFGTTGTPDNIGPGLSQGPTTSQDFSRDFWLANLREAIRERSATMGAIADQALRHHPTSGELLLTAALAALLDDVPSKAQLLLKRFGRRFIASPAATLLTALALAQKAEAPAAWTMLQVAQLTTLHSAAPYFVGGSTLYGWLSKQLQTIRSQAVQARTKSSALPRVPKKPAAPRGGQRLSAVPEPRQATAPDAALLPAIAALPKLAASFEMAFEFTNLNAMQLSAPASGADPTSFRLRRELVRLGLFEGFDELLCLPALQGVEPHWYQVETVRKVLKQHRGRVLLADEVGLGKTIEAGMVLKEYMLRGMAERILILAPASLVGQWRDEMEAKFGIACATSHDPLLRADPHRFWAQPRVIASIAVARRKDQAELLGGLSYDVVVVDEAHHLRDQASASYRLVNGLQKRFLLLLSATPVQNSLLELYNLLTLLQPGIFKTQKEFRAAYMVPGKPREPANRDRLRDLMRGVMVRNTRALAALRMTRRHASTLRVVPESVEAECYTDLSTLVREAAAHAGSTDGGQHRLSLQHMLSAAGSSPTAAAAAIERFVERHPGEARWQALLDRSRAVGAGAKEAALLRLLAQNPAEKKLVFVHHRDSLTAIADRLRHQEIRFTLFTGDMSGPQKDAAVEAFRHSVPILLCTESGGEGHNLQFCNTLINFDIPWNPMAIEQRIGRIDRIGQTREVFVFNLVTAGTIEEAVLRILDEKINMFELVVGEVGAILGEVDEQQNFATLVLEAWLEGTAQARTDAFGQIEAQLLTARRQYEGIKQLDDALFGSDLDVA